MVFATVQMQILAYQALALCPDPQVQEQGGHRQTDMWGMPLVRAAAAV